MRLLLIPIALALGTLGCNSGEVGCTLIGCTDELEIKLVPSWSGDYTIELVLDGKPASFRCAGERPQQIAGGLVVTRCASDGATLLAAPVKIDVKVSVGVLGDGGPMTGPSDRTGSFTPMYVTSQPNGPTCEPTCRQAAVTPN